MDKVRSQLWANYFKHLANRMGLSDWRVVMRSEPTREEDDAAAQLQCIFGKKVAQIRLNERWEEYAPARQREFAIHELIHSHLHAADTFLINSIKVYMSEREQGQFYREYEHLTEFAVDGLAKAFAAHLALPGEVIPDLCPADGAEFSEDIGEGYTEGHYERDT